MKNRVAGMTILSFSRTSRLKSGEAAICFHGSTPASYLSFCKFPESKLPSDRSWKGDSDDTWISHFDMLPGARVSGSCFSGRPGPGVEAEDVACRSAGPAGNMELCHNHAVGTAG